MNPIDEIKEMIELCEFVIRIGNSGINPQLKYDLIFTEGVAARILDRFDLGSMYGYYDPDTSSRSDVHAFVGAVDKLLIDLRKAVLS